MSKDKRTGWLADLKVGDEVGVQTSSQSVQTGISCFRVAKISPTGRITLDNRAESVYNAQGAIVGATEGWQRLSLVPLDAAREHNRKVSAGNLCSDVRRLLGESAYVPDRKWLETAAELAPLWDEWLVLRSKMQAAFDKGADEPARN
jgi:hypothetical protein